MPGVDTYKANCDDDQHLPPRNLGPTDFSMQLVAWSIL